ncbi:hypothetical protein D3C86_1866080 [compost metagenome]
MSSLDTSTLLVQKQAMNGCDLVVGFTQNSKNGIFPTLRAVHVAMINITRNAQVRARDGWDAPTLAIRFIQPVSSTGLRAVQQRVESSLALLNFHVIKNRNSVADVDRKVRSSHRTIEHLDDAVGGFTGAIQ